MRLTPLGRILWLLLNLTLGGFPSLLFFVWVERNTALPVVPTELGWPWMPYLDAPLWLLCAWNMGLFFAFGFLHSALAQPRAYRWMARVLPPQAHRTVYLIFTGLSLIGLMACWQHTGKVLWRIPGPPQLTSALSLVIFWALLAASQHVVAQFDSLEFLGLRQIFMRSEEIGRTEGMPELRETGIYGVVRHPMYTFTLLAFVLAPLMTLDRMLVFIASLIYLFFAIPVEERKLLAIFGTRYEAYRKRVPAVFPCSRLAGQARLDSSKLES